MQDSQTYSAAPKKAQAGNRILDEHLGETVTVVTTRNNFISSEAGDIIEIPLTYTGVLLDYNRQFVMLMDTEHNTSTISRAFLVSIERASPVGEIMADPNKPKHGDMN
jgi:hypothetical protein